MMPLLSECKILQPQAFTSYWMAPSNIAFVKYWGKRENQIPANSSLSLTLKECLTKTKTQFTPSSELRVELLLSGERNDAFSAKMFNYVEKLSTFYPVLSQVDIRVETQNTFPHGAGIASSASGMAAFALTLTDYLYHLSSRERTKDFFQHASYLARLGSGSACRSLYGGFTGWGSALSNDYAAPIDVHDQFQTLNDSILVISSEEKKVSSSAGHSQMKGHYFAERRFDQANDHFARCMSALKTGDIEEVGTILESEALALHAMMLTSPKPFTLFHPNTIKGMNIVWQFRQDTKIPVYFTLDAGPNLHLIYPDAHKKNVLTFINSELNHLCEMVIHDRVGDGPAPC
jgi:diphosphomevalonate decarboxylase